LLCFASTGVTRVASIGVPEAMFIELPFALADAELEVLPEADAEWGAFESCLLVVPWSLGCEAFAEAAADAFVWACADALA